MLKSVTVTNPAGESLVLELGAPERSGLLIEDITGLGPAKANLNMTALATSDGKLYNSARLDARNIVFTFGMMFDPMIEDSRQKTYRYFPIKKRVKLTFETDNRYCYCYGYVETNEPNVFAKRETTQISIICPDPYFYSEGAPISSVFSGFEPLFQFPFSNESKTEKLIQMGNQKVEHSGTILYDGEVEAGMIITIRALSTIGDITVYNADTDEFIKILTSKVPGGFKAGDEIIISTYRGNKYAQLLRDGNFTNIINAVAKDSNWLQLYAGANMFIYTAESGEDDLEFKIEYRLVFEGV